MFYKNRVSALIIVLFFLTTTLVSGKSFYVDSAHSSVKFKVKCLMVGRVTGKFTHFVGNYKTEGDNLKSFDAICYTNSINTGNKKRDKSLKSVYFFNSSQFPKMTMKMLKLNGNKMLIRLTIKDITKTVMFNYTPYKNPKKQESKKQMHFRITGNIYLKNFNLDMKKAVGPKGAVLGKTVKIVADIKGVEKNILDESIDSVIDSVKQIFAPQ